MKNEKTSKPDTRSFLSTLGAIAWSFIGLRRRKDFEQDIGRMNPFYVLIAALIGTGIFIAVLLTVVNHVVS